MILYRLNSIYNLPRNFLKQNASGKVAEKLPEPETAAIGEDSLVTEESLVTESTPKITEQSSDAAEIMVAEEISGVKINLDSDKKCKEETRPFILPVTHVLFDLDGVIIESESIYEKISIEIAQEYGKTYTKELKSKVMGTPEFETCRLIATELNLPITPAECLKKYEEKVMEELQNPSLLPGVADLIKHLYKHNIPIAIATSSRQDVMKMKTKTHQDLVELFHHVVCGSSDPEVKNNKPAPDIFLVCASRFSDKPNPSQCLVIEDSPNGVLAAVHAGMQVVMVPNPDLDAEHPVRSRATLVLKSLKYFLPEMFGLPPRD